MLMVLTLITIIAAGVLAAVNAVTAPQIDKINADNLAAGIKAVMGSKDIQVSEPWESDGFTVYDISDNAGEKLGKAVVTVQNGFGGPLKVLVGFNPEGDILGYTLLEHAETPGLGAKAGEWFQDKIIGVNPGKSNFTVSKDGGDIDAITASTITSRAFLLAIKNAYDKTIMGVDGTSGATAQNKAGKTDKSDKAGRNCKFSKKKCRKGVCTDCPKKGECCADKCADCPNKDNCGKNACVDCSNNGCRKGTCKSEPTVSDMSTPEVIE